MKITDVRTVLLTGPISNDPSMLAAVSRRSAAFVEIHTDTELIGIGETYLGYHLPAVVPTIVEFFKPILVNGETLDIHTLRQRMISCSIYWGRVGIGPAVISAIEAALWDLKGKMYGLPVYELLGGKRHDSLPAYATGGASNWPMARLFAKVDFYLELGFTGFKVGGARFDEETGMHVREKSTARIVEFEAQKVAALREHVGPDVKIMLDGHMGFRQDADQWGLETTVQMMRELESYDLFFFEEPLAYSDPHAYAVLAASTSVRIAGGESLTTFEEFDRFAEVGSFDVAQPDAAWLSITDFLRVGQRFAEKGRKVASHAWGAGCATMQNVHAAFATPNTLILELPPAAGPLHTEVWGDSLHMVNGNVMAPTAPGLGVTLGNELKQRFPYVPGVEEFVNVPGKSMLK